MKRLIFIVVCLPALIWAQDGYDAYNRGRLAEAHNHLLNPSGDLVEIDFLRAAMTTDADSAVQIYRQIALQNPESEIGRRALDRICQYYYAQGIYNRAEEMGKSLGNWEPSQRRLRTPESTPPPPFALSQEVLPRPEMPDPPQAEPEEIHLGKYALQVGAFSQPENAETLRARLEEGGYTAVILDPSETATNLYMVRVVGYDDITDAFEAAEKLEAEFGIKPIVVATESGG
jgi:cell division septation protein DedD